MHRTVLVLRGSGFIAGFVGAALFRAGWSVSRGTARPHTDSPDERSCDLTRIEIPQDAHALLESVDAVVNVAGILRRPERSFDAIHYRGPLAIAEACVERWIRPFVQISALGTKQDGAFVSSKHRLDEALLAMDLDAIVLRPSVVYSMRGSYGGTSALPILAWRRSLQRNPSP